MPTLFNFWGLLKFHTQTQDPRPSPSSPFMAAISSAVSFSGSSLPDSSSLKNSWIRSERLCWYSACLFMVMTRMASKSTMLEIHEAWAFLRTMPKYCTLFLRQALARAAPPGVTSTTHFAFVTVNKASQNCSGLGYEGFHPKHKSYSYYSWSSTQWTEFAACSPASIVEPRCDSRISACCRPC